MPGWTINHQAAGWSGFKLASQGFQSMSRSVQMLKVSINIWKAMNLLVKPASPSWAEEDAVCWGKTDDWLWTEARLCNGRNEWLFLTAALLLLLCPQDSSGVINNSAFPDPHPTQTGINGSLAGERDSETFGSGEEQWWWHFLLSRGRTNQSFAI